MNYFPNSDEEINLISFIGKYQYLAVNDIRYFFNTNSYYKCRIKNLVEKGYLKRVKLKLVLDEYGIEYCKLLGLKYSQLRTNQKYLPRLLFISHLAAFYMNNKNVNFTPSIDIKDKECFTTSGRRFVGLLEINERKYLTYHILKEHDKAYKNSVIYDMQKEQEYKNIIIFVDNIQQLNINDFSLGYPHVLLIENTDENKEKLQYLHSIDWHKVIEQYYQNKVFLSEYNFCDYSDNKNKFISTFYFLDTEKINKIKIFLREHPNKNIDIVCSKELQELIKKEIPNANFCIVNLENYIVKEQNIYD